MNESLRVLLVEDSEQDAELLIHHLESNGYTVQQARVWQASDLREALSKGSWDIILADHSMPGFSSLEALHILKDFTLDIPFVLVSGVIGEEAAVAAMKLGASDFVHKENLSRLVPAIEREIREAQNRRQLAEAERRARQNQTDFVLAINALDYHIAILDQQGTILAVNEAWKRFALENEFPEEDAGVGWNYLEVCRTSRGVYSAEAGRVAEGILAILRGEMETFSVEYPCHGPSVNRWFMVRISSFQSQDGPRVVVAHENVTERRVAEDELRSSESRFQSIFDFAPTIMFLKDAQGRYVLFNKQIEEFWGKSKSDIIGKTDRELFPSEVAEVFVRNDSEVFLKNVTIQHEELATGAVGDRIFLTTKFPIRDQTGVPYMICGIATDITERRALERQLVESQRMDAVGHLAAGVAHDFNNLLQAILAYSQFAQARIEEDHQAQEDLSQVVKAAFRAADLTRQLLTFSRQTEMRTAPLNLSPILKETMKLLQRTIPATISIRLEIENNIRSILGDNTQLQQVLLNLCVNAKDAMPGGGTLTVSLRKASINDAPASLDRPEDTPECVVLSVRDNGTGIAEENLPHIFEPFFTTKRPGEGTGLGLATSYGIVKQHGGIIVCESEVGKGSTFTIWFHACKAKDTSRKAAADTATLPKGLESILVVDDQEAIRNVEKRVLEELGYRVLTASNGKEAIDIFRDHADEIQLTLMDVQMPLLDGISCASKIRELKPEARIIISSGYYDPDLLGRVNTLGLSDFLPKPYTMTDLALKVREVLDRA